MYTICDVRGMWRGAKWSHSSQMWTVVGTNDNKQTIKCPADIGWAFASALFAAHFHTFELAYPDIFTERGDSVYDDVLY
jgi:hypothetical protein